ncbi:MAG: hypothetical protein FGM46_04720 [Ferruginibacter sp.]|nr:hypothetical protein [Ferruginibacter sp.]
MAASKPIITTSFSYQTLEEKLDVKPKGEALFIGIPRETSFNENRINETIFSIKVCSMLKTFTSKDWS